MQIIVVRVKSIIQKTSFGLILFYCISKSVIKNQSKIISLLLSGVVGFKIELSRIEGKLKLGQQRAKEDQVGVFNALSNSKNLDDLALANYMEKLNVGIGS